MEYLEIANMVVEWCLLGGVALYIFAIIFKKFDPFKDTKDKEEL